jgi:hypothetical protein
MSPTNVPDSVRARVREAAGDCCGYCLSPQKEDSPLLAEGSRGAGSVITF